MSLDQQTIDHMVYGMVFTKNLVHGGIEPPTLVIHTRSISTTL